MFFLLISASLRIVSGSPRMKRLEWERQKYRRRGSRMGKLQKWARQEWEWEGDREEDEEEGGTRRAGLHSGSDV